MFDELTQLCNGLVYVSETDSPVTPYHYRRESLRLPLVYEERDFNAFMDNQIRMCADWQPLKDFMTANLTDCKLFVCGEINVIIYGVGVSGGETWGFRTTGVET